MSIHNSKLNANSLAITIIVSIILAILCSSLILLSYYNKRFEIQSYKAEKINRNLQSGIALVMADTTTNNNFENYTVDLFGKGDDSMEIGTYPWGIYNIAVIKAIGPHENKNIKLFYGSKLPEYLNSCIYLIDEGKPLYLIGH